MREHDMKEESLRCVLDCAHAVFNAVTGVTVAKERMEIRGFRSVLEWRKIIEGCGFKDLKVYEMQPHDCTKDVMMAFCKPGEYEIGRALEMSQMPDEQETAASRIASAVPRIALKGGLGIVNSLLRTLPEMRKFLIGLVNIFLKNVPGVSEAISKQIENAIDGWLEMLERFQPLADNVTPVSGSNGPSFVPDEIFLLIPLLRVRAKKGALLESIIIDLYDKIVDGISEERSDANNQTAKDVKPSGPSAITEAEFDKEIKEIKAAIPEFKDLDKTIRESGIPSKAAELLVSALTEENQEKLRTWILETMDRR